jgi:hypothetical protein
MWGFVPKTIFCTPVVVVELPDKAPTNSLEEDFPVNVWSELLLTTIRQVLRTAG